MTANKPDLELISKGEELKPAIPKLASTSSPSPTSCVERLESGLKKIREREAACTTPLTKEGSPPELTLRLDVKTTETARPQAPIPTLPQRILGTLFTPILVVVLCTIATLLLVQLLRTSLVTVVSSLPSVPNPVTYLRTHLVPPRSVEFRPLLEGIVTPLVGMYCTVVGIGCGRHTTEEEKAELEWANTARALRYAGEDAKDVFEGVMAIRNGEGSVGWSLRYAE